MPEAISTQNLVTLPITSQELGSGGGGLFCPPTKIGLSNSPTTIGLSGQNSDLKLHYSSLDFKSNALIPRKFSKIQRQIK